MNSKQTNVPIYIAIIVALILIAAGGYFVLGPKVPIETPPVKEVPTPTPVTAEATEVKPPAEKTPAEVAPTPALKEPETIKCKLCHIKPQEIPQHINGGKYCIDCHGSQVHNLHVGAGTVGLSCEACHGLPPNIRVPRIEKGEEPGKYSVCEQCHAPPPKSLEPSMGELVVVHLSRDKSCTTCHIGDIGTIHMAAITNASKK